MVFKTVKNWSSVAKTSFKSQSRVLTNVKSVTGGIVSVVTNPFFLFVYVIAIMGIGFILDPPDVLSLTSWSIFALDTIGSIIFLPFIGITIIIDIIIIFMVEVIVLFVNTVFGFIITAILFFAWLFQSGLNLILIIINIVFGFVGFIIDLIFNFIIAILNGIIQLIFALLNTIIDDLLGGLLDTIVRAIRLEIPFIGWGFNLAVTIGWTTPDLVPNNLITDTFIPFLTDIQGLFTNPVRIDFIKEIESVDIILIDQATKEQFLSFSLTKILIEVSHLAGVTTLAEKLDVIFDIPFVESQGSFIG